PENGPKTQGMSMARVLLRILSFIRPHQALLAGVLAYLVFSLLCELAGPMILGKTIDLLIALGTAGAGPEKERLWGEILTFGGSFLFVGLLGQVLNLRKEILRTRLSTKALCDIRVTLYEAIQRLCFRYHDSNHSGDLITKATRDVYSVHTLY